MIQIRKSSDRGHFDFGWLNTYHTFSFADYYDPQQMGFRVLRVINDDTIAAGKGFGTHPHRDMEIITYVTHGALEHKDSMGNGGVIHAGEIQYMSAGSGVTHSEFNHEKSESTHLFQIWMMPDEKGAVPRYDQKKFEPETKKGKLKLLVSKTGEEGSIAIRQDAKIFAAILEKGEKLSYPLSSGRYAWIQMVNGKIDVNGISLGEKDGAAVEKEKGLAFAASGPAEFLLFDLP